MNSDEKRLIRHFQSSYDNPNIYQLYYSQSRIWDRLRQPGLLLSLVLLAVFAYHHIASQNPHLLPRLPELLWNTLVRITPARLLYAVDGWLNPPLFPNPMLETQRRPSDHTAKSEVLKRVLGVDKPGSIMASVSQVGKRSLPGFGSNSFTKGDSEQPAGLGNWDNSCYQNSILQGLASLQPLRAFLNNLGTDANTETRTVDTLRGLIEDLCDRSNNGKTLWTPRVLKNMSTWQQQDAQEYFSKLLDEVDNEVAKLVRTTHKPAGFETDLSATKDETVGSQHSDDSGYQSLSGHSKAGSVDLKLSHNPLEGFQAQRVACTACKHSEGLSMNPFNCLTLSLGTDGGDQSIYELLDAYTKVESIPGVECTKCTLLKFQSTLSGVLENLRARGSPDETLEAWSSKLHAVDEALQEDNFDDKTMKTFNIPKQVSSTKTKQAVIARPPKSLVVHMNRSVFDETSGQMLKNFATVKFPTDLDLGPWCLGSRIVDEETEGKEQWPLDPNLSMVAGSQERSRLSGPLYELRAVITHYGRHDNGHYICYRKHGQARRDQTVEESEKPAQLVDQDGDHDMLQEEKKTTPDEEADVPDQDSESQWWRLSDRDVNKVTEETVLGQTGVFMLFYDCVDPNPVLLSETDEFEDSVSLQGDDDRQPTGNPATVDDMPVEGMDWAPPTPLPDEVDDVC
jgi:ubiquitin carboxyl-terminal hydrolase 1